MDEFRRRPSRESVEEKRRKGSARSENYRTANMQNKKTTKAYQERSPPGKRMREKKKRIVASQRGNGRKCSKKTLSGKDERERK